MRSHPAAFVVFLLLAASPVRADKFGGFKEFADSGSLKPFARDLGGILGSATFHSGRSLGFSGYDLGARVGAQFQPDEDNRILRRKGVKAVAMPWVQAEVGLPFRFDVFVRGISYQGITISGGGLRWGILKVSDKPWTPQALLSAVAHSVVHQHFSASHVGGSLVVSMGIPMWTPYLGGGVDRTRLVARDTNDASIRGHVVTETEARLTAGMQFKPWTFVYLNAAYTLVHDQSGAEGGLGFRF